MRRPATRFFDARLIKKFGPKIEFSEEEIGIALDELEEEDAFPPDPL